MANSWLSFLALGLERARAEQERDYLTSQDVPLDQWWGDATAKRPEQAYHRLIAAVQLAVEERYTIEGDAIGLYAEAAGIEGGAYKFFSRFVLAVQGEGLMPPWWTWQHWKGCKAVALDRNGGSFIYHAVEVSDVRQEWGYETSKLLRCLAYRIHEALHGETGRWRYGCVREDRTEDCYEMPVCRKHFSGYCKWGSFCIYQHPAREKMPVCRFFLEGRCCKGSSCPFSHLEETSPRSVVASEQEEEADEHQDEEHEVDAKLVTGDGFSRIALVDHLIEVAGGVDELGSLTLLYQSAVGVAYGRTFDYSTVSIEASTSLGPRKRKSQMVLKEKASAGDATAQCYWGKVMKEVSLTCYCKVGSRHDAALKVWTESARAGHALAMAGLALMHRDAGYQSTAIHWWKRALQIAAVPEASYNIGISFGLGEKDSTIKRCDFHINYHSAAKYYAHTADIDLKFQSEVPKGLVETLLDMIGPNNDDQSGYQRRAKDNLRLMERYLSDPESAPDPSGAVCPDDSPKQVNDEQDIPFCLCCERRPQPGEQNLLRCGQCKAATYCNSLCQKGHWSSHKADCKKL